MTRWATPLRSGGARRPGCSRPQEPQVPVEVTRGGLAAVVVEQHQARGHLGGVAAVVWGPRQLVRSSRRLPKAWTGFIDEHFPGVEMWNDR